MSKFTRFFKKVGKYIKKQAKLTIKGQGIVFDVFKGGQKLIGAVSKQAIKGGVKNISGAVSGVAEGLGISMSKLLWIVAGVAALVVAVFVAKVMITSKLAGPAAVRGMIP
jgi:phage shock protein PspC (stress-responsive transcriptional regulator)